MPVAILPGCPEPDDVIANCDNGFPVLCATGLPRLKPCAHPPCVDDLWQLLSIAYCHQAIEP